MKSNRFRRVALLTMPFTQAPGPFYRLTHFAEPPLGLASLAGSLRKWNPDTAVDIIDAHALLMNHRQLLDRVKAYQPDLVGLTTVSLTAGVTSALAREIKSVCPDAKIVAGGPHPTALPDDLLDDVDAVALGEGEQTFSEVVAGKPWGEIEGLAHKVDGEVRFNAPRPFLKDLDELGFPAFDLLPLPRYRYPYPMKKARGNYATYFSSRGCPSKCTFCAQMSVWGHRVRFHSVERVIEDLQRLVDDFRVTLLHFYDDTLLFHRKRVFEMCEEMIRRKWPLRWICLARGMDIDDEVAEIAARAGCGFIEVGVDTANEGIIQTVKKDSTVDEVRRAFRSASKHGIHVKGNFIIGLPGETPESVREAIDLATTLDATYVNFFHFVPIPGSDLYDEYHEKGWMKATDWGKYHFHHSAVVELPGISTQELNDTMQRALRAFYLRPKTWWRFVRVFFESLDFRTFALGVLAIVNEIIVRPHKDLGATKSAASPAVS